MERNDTIRGEMIDGTSAAANQDKGILNSV
jgi:hypothetical protein